MTLRAIASDASIELFEHHLVITRRRPGLLTDRPSAEQFIPLASIKSVQFIRPGFMARGRLTLTLEGSISSKPGASTDQNSVSFSTAQLPEFERVHSAIREAIAVPSIERLAMAAQRRQSVGSATAPPDAGTAIEVVRQPNTEGRSSQRDEDEAESSGYHPYSSAGESQPAPSPNGLVGLWRDMPMLGKVILVGLALTVLLSMCSPSTSSPDSAASNEVAETPTASPGDAKSDETASSTELVIDSCYHLEDCGKYRIITQGQIASRADERLVKARLLYGEVPNASGDEQPQGPIQWSDSTETYYALCSKRRPLIAFKSGSKWIAQTFDFIGGVPGAEQNSANIYEALCHGFFGDELASSAKSLGYRPTNEGGQQFEIGDPRALLSPGSDGGRNSDDDAATADQQPTGGDLYAPNNN